MTSTISSNNKKNSFVALTKWSLLKAVPVTAIYSSILFLAFPVLFFTLDINRQISVYSTIKIVLTYLIPAIVMIFTIIVGANMFGIYQKKRSIDLYGSFPVKRRTLLLSKYVAGLIVLLIPLFVFGLLGGITPYFSSVDKETYNVVAVVMSKCITIAIGVIASYTMFTFLSMCCGKTSSSIISYIVINMIYPFLILFLIAVFASIVPGFSYLLIDIFPVEMSSYTTPFSIPGIIVCFLSPVLATFIGADLDFFNMDIPEFFSKYIEKSEFIVYWILFIAVVLACALYIAQKRKNENVQNGFIYKLPQIIVTILATVTMGIFIGFLFENTVNLPSIFSCLLGTFAGGLLAFTVFTLLYNRGISGFIKELPILGVSYVIVIISSLVISTGVFGADSYVPKTENIKSVAVISDIAGYEAESYDNYLNSKNNDEYASTHISWYLDKDKNIVPMNYYMSDESIIKDTVAMHQNIVDNLNNIHGNLYSIDEVISGIISDTEEKPRYPQYLDILYKMKDGSVIERTYYYSDYDVAELHNMYNKIASTETYKNQYFALMQCDYECITSIDIMGNYNGLNPILAGEDCIKYNNNQQIVKELYEALRKDVIADKDLVTTFNIEKGYTEWNKWNYGDEMIIEIEYDNSYYSSEYMTTIFGAPSEIFIIPKDKYTNVWNVLEKYSNDELNFKDKSGFVLYN